MGLAQQGHQDGEAFLWTEHVDGYAGHRRGLGEVAAQPTGEDSPDVLVVCIPLNQRAGRGVRPPGVQTAQQHRPGLGRRQRGRETDYAVCRRLPQIAFHVGAKSLSESRIVAPLLRNHADVIQDQAACLRLCEFCGSPGLETVVAVSTVLRETDADWRVMLADSDDFRFPGEV